MCPNLAFLNACEDGDLEFLTAILDTHPVPFEIKVRGMAMAIQEEHQHIMESLLPWFGKTPSDLKTVSAATDYLQIHFNWECSFGILSSVEKACQTYQPSFLQLVQGMALAIENQHQELIDFLTPLFTTSTPEDQPRLDTISPFHLQSEQDAQDGLISFSMELGAISVLQGLTSAYH